MPWHLREAQLACQLPDLPLVVREQVRVLQHHRHTLNPLVPHGLQMMSGGCQHKRRGAGSLEHPLHMLDAIDVQTLQITGAEVAEFLTPCVLSIRQCCPLVWYH